ncbi:ABC transporter ATP-binding protein [Elstera cyanobacteriorum]|uniref:ABC transporter ATP-binding protein n=1 Tax=Elstera cyanobacteriorum TaxID=2022747 RepID=A0A255XYY9_9PROT|nr:ABC transporter ATP-binding protein [Elstera cyanobacteriorum]OYQ22229.1 ABC transporter ATP-binding protein [Elstera cyanobacteriorum]GGA02343.1 ABC transporter ATP-binding protein [Elstera cyanobacteriorum]
MTRIAPAPLGIHLTHCGKHFPDGTQALTPLDLDIHPGETLVLLGPSGCGKTTLLRLIAGLESPDAGGRIQFGGRDVTALPIEKRQVGMVFQSYALFPNMSVRGNIDYGLRVRGDTLTKRCEKTDEMLAMMRLTPLADRRIDQLSGGQRQRVALARALAVDPAVLLLDEPLTALDAKLRDTLRTEIAALLRQVRVTAVFVTHDQAEAMALGDRIVVMSAGKIAQIGSPREIYAAPASRFVADFIGTLNILPGRKSGTLWETPLGTLPWPAAPQQGEALFRPEAVRLDPTGPLTATVATRFFVGDRVRLLFDVPGQRPIALDAPAHNESEAGDKLCFTIAPEHLFALPETA